MNKLEKGQVVTLIDKNSKGVITIWNDVVSTAGPVVIRFEGDKRNHQLSHLLPTEELFNDRTNRGFFNKYIANDEAFIERYIALATAYREKSLAEIDVELKENPGSSRLMFHKNSHAEPIVVIDRRAVEESA